MKREDLTHTKDGMIYYMHRPIGISKTPAMVIDAMVKYIEDYQLTSLNFTADKNLLHGFDLTTMKMLVRHDNGIRFDCYGRKCTVETAMISNLSVRQVFKKDVILYEKSKMKKV